METLDTFGLAVVASDVASRDVDDDDDDDGSGLEAVVAVVVVVVVVAEEEMSLNCTKRPSWKEIKRKRAAKLIIRGN